MKGTSGLLLAILVFFGFGCMCSNLQNPSQPAPILNSPTPQVATNPSSQPFSPDAVCALPKQIASSTPFASLGGGVWGKFGETGGELDYGCNGGKDFIKLLDDGSNDITAEYGAIGGPQNVHYVTAEYMALQYSGQTTTERKLREQYAEFCDKLSEKFYGVKLPAKFRKRLLDETAYSDSGTANEYAEKAGSGYVNLSSNKNGTKMILLDVHFFSSEDEYKRYKDE